MRASFLLLFGSLVVFGAFGVCYGGGLKRNFYRTTCPNAEKIVRNVAWNFTAADPGLAAGLFRLHFHDCFVRGCDASLLLDSTPTNQAEKEAIPNLSIKGFDVIDNIKAKIEQVCPGVVSCADIAALAARDAVSFQFNKSKWDVLTGRKDGRVSLASEVIGNIPSPFANFTSLQQQFANKGLNLKDLVTLSGAHTIGKAHCGLFARRLNFTGAGDADPSLDTFYAGFLRKKCPANFDPATAVDMDPQSGLAFDSHYFTTLNQNRGLFQSDAALLTNKGSAKIVNQMLNPKAFLSQFAVSMQKMGAIGVLTGKAGEIRKQCRLVNS